MKTIVLKFKIAFITLRMKAIEAFRILVIKFLNIRKIAMYMDENQAISVKLNSDFTWEEDDIIYLHNTILMHILIALHTLNLKLCNKLYNNRNSNALEYRKNVLQNTLYYKKLRIKKANMYKKQYLIYKYVTPLYKAICKFSNVIDFFTDTCINRYFSREYIADPYFNYKFKAFYKALDNFVMYLLEYEIRFRYFLEEITISAKEYVNKN